MNKSLQDAIASLMSTVQKSNDRKTANAKAILCLNGLPIREVVHPKYNDKVIGVSFETYLDSIHGKLRRQKAQNRELQTNEYNAAAFRPGYCYLYTDSTQSGDTNTALCFKHKPRGYDPELLNPVRFDNAQPDTVLCEPSLNILTSQERIYTLLEKWYRSSSMEHIQDFDNAEFTFSEGGYGEIPEILGYNIYTKKYFELCRELNDKGTAPAEFIRHAVLVNLEVGQYYFSNLKQNMYSCTVNNLDEFVPVYYSFKNLPNILKLSSVSAAFTKLFSVFALDNGKILSLTLDTEMLRDELSGYGNTAALRQIQRPMYITESDIKSTIYGKDRDTISITGYYLTRYEVMILLQVGRLNKPEDQGNLENARYDCIFYRILEYLIGFIQDDEVRTAIGGALTGTYFNFTLAPNNKGYMAVSLGARDGQQFSISYKDYLDYEWTYQMYPTIWESGERKHFYDPNGVMGDLQKQSVQQLMMFAKNSRVSAESVNALVSQFGEIYKESINNE